MNKTKVIRSILLIFWTLWGTVDGRALNYYWVGGTGNWSDINHWSAVPGGGTMQLHSVTPTSQDDVFINAQSFPSSGGTITISVPIAFCRSLTIIGIPNNSIINLISPSKLRVFGSLNVEAPLSWQGNGELLLESPNAGNTIRAHNVSLSNISLNSITGAWTLVDSLEVVNFHGVNGVFNSDKKFIQCTSFNLYNSTQSTLDSSIIRCGNSFNTGNSSVLTTTGTRLTLVSGNINNWTNAPHKFDLVEVLLSGSINASSAMDSKKTIFVGDGGLSGPWKSDSLVFSPGKTYTLNPNASLQIDHFVANGTCTQPISVQTSTLRSTATINIQHGDTLNYTSVRDITNSGATQFLFDGSILHNSPGFSILASSGRTMFWVNGSGSYNDPNHWSLTSGGAPINCVPGPRDTAVFDNNSGNAGFTVDFSTEQYQIGSLISFPTSVPITFTGNAKPLQIMGDLVIKGTSVWNTIKAIGMYCQDTAIIDLSPSVQPVRLALNTDAFWAISDSIHIGLLSTNDGTLLGSKKFIQTGTWRDNVSENTGLNVSGLTPIFKLDSAHVLVASEGAFTNPFGTLFAGGSNVYFGPNSALTVSNALYQWNRLHWLGQGGEAKLYGTVNSRYLSIQSDALINDVVNVDSLILGSGQSFRTNNVSFGYIDADGGCSRRTVLTSKSSNTSNWTGKGYNHAISDAIFELISFSNGTLTAINSIDNGQVSGVQFTTTLGRTLYWVGGSGEWNDSTHWSLQSSGVGGACIPGPADSVVIDNQSNPSLGLLSILIASPSFTRDLNSVATLFNVHISRNPNYTPSCRLEVYGSFMLGQNTSFSIVPIFFRAPIGSHVLQTNYNAFNRLYFIGQGTYSVLDSLRAQYLDQNSGTINGYGNFIRITGTYSGSGGVFMNQNARMAFGHGNSNNSIDFSSSTLEISYTLTLNGSVSLPSTEILFLGQNSSLTTNSSDTITRVKFINPSGTGAITCNPISYIQYVELFGNGVIHDSLQVDTLIFHNGRSYQLTPNKTVRVKEFFDVHGDFCNPILIRSKTQGSRAFIKTWHTVSGNYLELRDLEYLGPGAFYAGDKSANQGNTVGIIWNTAPGYIYGFPEDLTLVQCGPSSDYVLTSERFQDAAGFLWNTGATTSSIVIDTSGVYWLSANYGGCTVSDTIEITFQTMSLHHIAQSRCLGDSIMLAPLGLASAKPFDILWSNGSSDSTLSFVIQTDTTIWYSATDILGRTCSDTLNFKIISKGITPDSLTILNCSGSFNLDSLLKKAIPDSYHMDTLYSVGFGQWHNNNTEYWGWVFATYYFDGCTLNDSTYIRWVNPSTINHRDSLLCKDNYYTFRIVSPHPGLSYYWSTGDSTTWTQILISHDTSLVLKITDDLGNSCTDSLFYRAGNTVSASVSPNFVGGIRPANVILFGSASGAHFFEWQNASGLILKSGFGNQDSFDFEFTSLDTMSVYFLGYDTASSCFDEAIVRSKVNVGLPYFIPNTFTPNNDGVNDFWIPIIWTPKLESLHCLISNRYGEIIYQTSGEEIQWDGLLSTGTPQNQDAYTYQIRFLDYDYRWVSTTGTVRLVL
jgi:gliding motility-associated-like protein